jgi:hypothetical protein
VSAWVRLLRREASAAYPLTEKALQFNAEHGYAFHVAVSEVLLGSLQVEDARDASGLAKMRGGIDGIGATGAGVFLPAFLGLFAEASIRLGDHDAGLQALREADGRFNQRGERWPEAEIYRLSGELRVLSGGDLRDGEQHFRRALEVAASRIAGTARRQQCRPPPVRTWAASRGARARIPDL